MNSAISPALSHLKKVIIKRKKRKCRLEHYKSLINILVSTGMVCYNGTVYRSIADLTIGFYNATSISRRPK